VILLLDIGVGGQDAHFCRADTQAVCSLPALSHKENDYVGYMPEG